MQACCYHQCRGLRLASRGRGAGQELRLFDDSPQLAAPVYRLRLMPRLTDNQLFADELA